VGENRITALLFVPYAALGAFASPFNYSLYLQTQWISQNTKRKDRKRFGFEQQFECRSRCRPVRPNWPQTEAALDLYRRHTNPGEPSFAPVSVRSLKLHKLILRPIAVSVQLNTTPQAYAIFSGSASEARFPNLSVVHPKTLA
jgi:hypothetical protein